MKTSATIVCSSSTKTLAKASVSVAAHGAARSALRAVLARVARVGGGDDYTPTALRTALVRRIRAAGVDTVTGRVPGAGGDSSSVRPVEVLRPEWLCAIGRALLDPPEWRVNVWFGASPRAEVSEDFGSRHAAEAFACGYSLGDYPEASVAVFEPGEDGGYDPRDRCPVCRNEPYPWNDGTLLVPVRGKTRRVCRECWLDYVRPQDTTEERALIAKEALAN